MAAASFRTERGLLWPTEDSECARVVFDMMKDMDPALAITPRRRLVLQAGGNCGVWARALAAEFETVVTAEPDPVNFHCLVANTTDLPVVCLQVALGDQPGWAGMMRNQNNCGAQYVDRDERSCRFPVVRIDDLGLPALDYLCLDIEGMEMMAIEGAWQAIQRHRPIIQCEDNGLSKRYGNERGDLEKRLATIGYRVAASPHKDVILAPD